jgi:branched-chain amino acid transport system permease protein
MEVSNRGSIGSEPIDVASSGRKELASSGGANRQVLTGDRDASSESRGFSAKSRSLRGWITFLCLVSALCVWYVESFGFASFLQQLINGLQRGSIYALIALGFTMVYGIIGLINFAQGDIFMFGAYIAAFIGASLLGYGHLFAFIGALLGTMLVTGGLGVLIERVAYRPLRTSPKFSALTTAMGVSIFLENFFAIPPRAAPFPLNWIVFGPDYRHFPTLIDVGYYSIGSIYFTTLHVLDFVLAMLLMVLLNYFVRHTNLGKSMRAVAFSMDGAKLMGINVNFVIAITFAVGSALSAAAGLMYGVTYGILASPYFGIFPGLQAFIAAVLGGIGSIPGAVLGGFVMGISETFATSVDSNLGYMSSFVILIVVLLFKPAGLLGTLQFEKV